MSYSVFAKFYDEAMGDMSTKIDFIKKLIKEHAPNAESVLEFASGTGTILQGLSETYHVAGVELSPEMLAIAHKKLQSIDMRLGDMTTFQFHKNFDVALCVFDSINHLLNWDDWTRLFNNAHQHLNNDGLFIFDINTIERLNWLASQSHEFKPGEETLSINIFESDNIFNWNITIPSDEDDHVIFKNETIQETSFPLEQIKAELSNLFVLEAIVDPKGLPQDNPNWRPFFICRKKV